MPYSAHPSMSQTPMHFRGGGVSKKLYHTNTQPRNITYNQSQQNAQSYERRHNVIDDIGLEVGPYSSVHSRPFDEHHMNGRATSQQPRPLTNGFSPPSHGQMKHNQSSGNIIIPIIKHEVWMINITVNSRDNIKTFILYSHIFRWSSAATASAASSSSSRETQKTTPFAAICSTNIESALNQRCLEYIDQDVP